MKIKSEKHRAAIETALSGKIALPSKNRIKLMKPMTLYNFLRSEGWRWNGREWIPLPDAWVGTRQPDMPEGQSHAKGLHALTDTFLVRIMAHKEAMPKLRASLLELLEVFDYDVLSVSEPRANYGEEDWQRIYIRARMP